MDYYKLKVLNNRKIIIIILLILVLALAGYYYLRGDSNESENQSVFINESIDDNILDNGLNNKSDEIIVDIKGFVSKPGVYSFKANENARINDLILKAGGLKKEADTSTINLSKKLEDEMTIIIYSKNEITSYLKTEEELKKKLEICENKLKNDACIKENTITQENQNKKININTAELEDLIKISGIGESKAKAIIEYRKKTKFKSIDDIKNVEGIGDSLFAAIKENITV